MSFNGTERLGIEDSLKKLSIVVINASIKGLIDATLAKESESPMVSYNPYSILIIGKKEININARPVENNIFFFLM